MFLNFTETSFSTSNPSIPSSSFSSVSKLETNIPVFGDGNSANTPSALYSTTTTTTTTTTVRSSLSDVSRAETIPSLTDTMKKTWNIGKLDKMKMMYDFTRYLAERGIFFYCTFFGLLTACTEFFYLSLIHI